MKPTSQSLHCVLSSTINIRDKKKLWNWYLLTWYVVYICSTSWVLVLLTDDYEPWWEVLLVLWCVIWNKTDMASILRKCVRDASHMLGDGGLLCRWVPVERIRIWYMIIRGSGTAVSSSWSLSPGNMMQEDPFYLLFLSQYTNLSHIQSHLGRVSNPRLNPLHHDHR